MYMKIYQDRLRLRIGLLGTQAYKTIDNQATWMEKDMNWDQNSTSGRGAYPSALGLPNWTF